MTCACKAPSRCASSCSLDRSSSATSNHYPPHQFVAAQPFQTGPAANNHPGGSNGGGKKGPGSKNSRHQFASGHNGAGATSVRAATSSSDFHKLRKNHGKVKKGKGGGAEGHRQTHSTSFFRTGNCQLLGKGTPKHHSAI